MHATSPPAIRRRAGLDYTMPLFEIVPNLSEGRDAAIDRRRPSTASRRPARACSIASSDAVHHRSVLTIAGDGDASARRGGRAGRRRARTDRLAAIAACIRASARSTCCRSFRWAERAWTTPSRSHTGPAHEIWERFGIPSFYYGAAARQPRNAGLLPAIRAQARRTGCPTKATSPRTQRRCDRDRRARRPDRLQRRAWRPPISRGPGDRARIRERDGGLRSLRALAFPSGDDRVQVSLNVTDYAATPLYRIVELIARLAAERGIELPAASSSVAFLAPPSKRPPPII